MPESARDLLRREFAELLVETRASWSARAVVQANRMLRGSDDREGRRMILVAELGIDRDGDGLWHTSEEIRQLESRAWLLDHFLTEAERERELAQVFVPEVRALRRTVSQADAIERRHRELRRARERRAARG